MKTHHIDKHAFTTPFVCGARNLGEALRRIAEGAAMIRTKGEAGTGDVVHAVQHMRQIVKEMKSLTVLERRGTLRRRQGASALPTNWFAWSRKTGKLPVPNFSAGGIATPADAALMMQLGRRGRLRRLRHLHEGARHSAGRRERSARSAKRPSPAPRAIVIATTHYNDPEDPRRSQRSGNRHHEGPGSGSNRRAQLLQTRGW